MQKPKFLIVSEQQNVFKLYELLFKDYFSDVKNLFIEEYDFIEAINFNQFNIVLIDLNGKKYISSINQLIKKNTRNCKIILVTHHDLNSFYQSLNDTQFFNLILSKPIDVVKLKNFIKNESEKLEKRNILEKKNNILANVVDLHPARIAF